MNLNTVLTKFLNKQNLKLLWEVLLDELHIDSNNKSIITNIRTVFESNIQPFTKNTSINTNIHANMQLTNLNNQFLSQFELDPPDPPLPPLDPPLPPFDPPSDPADHSVHSSWGDSLAVGVA